jgi:4-amino-4-deoxy-L-arabinose transferase-like glycosyltransferase
VVAAILAATSGRYGYHRDELYFLMLKPAWGYVDQPPLTPMLARAASALFGGSPTALRIPAILCVAVAILLSALTARELGGGRLAQAWAAWGFGLAGLTLISGHLMVTGTVDFPLWAAVLLCITRAQLRGNPRWWLAAGALVGLSMYNKLLIAMLLISLAVALPLAGPRKVLRSPWLWGGVGLALVIGAPNLIYQATHDFPQFTMAQSLSDNNGGDVRWQLLPFEILLVGLPLFWVCVLGFLGLWRRPQWRPIRFIAVAYLVILVLAIIGGGQIYYPFGLLTYLLAAGSVVVAQRWPGRAGTWRLAVTVGLNGVVSVLTALPLLPVTTFGDTPIGDVNQTLPDQVGWPVYVRTVADVYRSLPAADQATAILLTGNYGEAGSLLHYGPEYGLPDRVYSGQNELWFQGPPPADATVAIVWTEGGQGLDTVFARCDRRAVMDNGVGVDNEEQGSIVAICRDPVGGWSAVWPRFQHYD